MSIEEKRKVLNEFVKLLCENIRFIKAHFVLRILEDGKNEKYLLKGEFDDPQAKWKEILDHIQEYLDKYDFEEFVKINEYYKEQMRNSFSKFTNLKPGFYKLGTKEVVAA